MTDKKIELMTVLEGLFFYLKREQDKGRRVFIPYSTPIFHKIIHQLAKRKKYQVFFSELLWQKRIFGSYCEAIEDYLSNMAMSKMLSYYSCFSLVKDRSYYVVEKKLSLCWEKYHQEETKEYAPLMEKLALDFIKAVNKEFEKKEFE